MRAGILLIVLYWALFTIRAGLQPKVAAEVKAATYDMKRIHYPGGGGRRRAGRKPDDHV